MITFKLSSNICDCHGSGQKSLTLHSNFYVLTITFFTLWDHDQSTFILRKPLIPLSPNAWRGCSAHILRTTSPTRKANNMNQSSRGASKTFHIPTYVHHSRATKNHLTNIKQHSTKHTCLHHTPYVPIALHEKRITWINHHVGPQKHSTFPHTCTISEPRKTIWRTLSNIQLNIHVASHTVCS